MKAILLAAGVGSRISRVVNTPKSLLMVNDETILGHSVDMLLRNNIDVAVVVGYKKDEIFASLHPFSVTYYYNPFYKVTNSIASLWFAKDFIDDGEDLILANADVFWTQPVLDTLLGDHRDIVILGDISRTHNGDYFLQQDGSRVISYGKDIPISKRTSEYVGIAKISHSHTSIFKKNMDALIDQGEYALWWENIMYNYLHTYPVHVKDISDLFWSEVDYIEDYQRILYHMESQKKAGASDKECRK